MKNKKPDTKASTSREERLRAALRANLQRRKQQARERADDDAVAASEAKKDRD